MNAKHCGDCAYLDRSSPQGLGQAVVRCMLPLANKPNPRPRPNVSDVISVSTRKASGQPLAGGRHA